MPKRGVIYLNPIKVNTTGISMPIVISAIGGALLGGILGYKYPKAATTLYGIALGSGLAITITSLIIARQEA